MTQAQRWRFFFHENLLFLHTICSNGLSNAYLYFAIWPFISLNTFLWPLAERTFWVSVNKIWANYFWRSFSKAYKERLATCTIHVVIYYTNTPTERSLPPDYVCKNSGEYYNWQMFIDFDRSIKLHFKKILTSHLLTKLVVPRV